MSKFNDIYNKHHNSKHGPFYALFAGITTMGFIGFVVLAITLHWQCVLCLAAAIPAQLIATKIKRGQESQ